MKLRHSLSIFGLVAMLGLGVGVGLASGKQEVKEAKADTTFYLDTASLTGWEDASAKFYLYVYDEDGGDSKYQYHLATKVNPHLFSVSVNTTGANGCKFIRVNPSDSPSGTYADGDVWGQGEWSSDFSKNYYCQTSWNSTYGSWETASPISVTLTASFTSAVPDYADIYIPGDFNSWAENGSKMTPNGARTTWSFTANNLARGSVSYGYKIVAGYTASGFDWNHKIATGAEDANLYKSLSYTDNGSSVVFLENSGYDFATNMPEQYAVEDATITLTMSSRIDASITVYLSSGLTGWANTAERLASAVMTPNAGRTVFTWTIPDNTPVGTYEYKIVAMYSNGGQTSASYDYVLKDNGTGGNASITLDDEANNYPLASSVTVPVLGAIAFSREFNTAMATRCADENANNKTAVSAIWGTHKSAFEALTDDAKTQFGSNNDTHVAQARALYLHCVSRYELATWTGAPVSSPRIITFSIGEQSSGNSTLIIIIAASSIAVLALIGGYFYFRKRKEDR